jgi:hypothetical protein
MGVESPKCAEYVAHTRSGVPWVGGLAVQPDNPEGALNWTPCCRSVTTAGLACTEFGVRCCCCCPAGIIVCCRWA